MRIFIIIIAALSLCSFSSGCLYEIRDEIVDCEINFRNKRRASAAWDACREAYETVEHVSDFKDGFISGYIAVANGGNGCPPSTPPAKYWKARFQTIDGKARTNAWFDGYAHGALAAQSDGVAYMNQIVTRGGRNGSGGHEVMLPSSGNDVPHEMLSTDGAGNSEFPPPSPAAETDVTVETDAWTELLEAPPRNPSIQTR